jgi:hypothetical protein
MPKRKPLQISRKYGEASALLACDREALLEAHGFEAAFWVARDEGPVEKSVVLVGHKRGRKRRKGWKVKRLRAAVAGAEGETDDAETLARWGGFVYVIGSHFGSKDGPLDPRRAFVARFREDALGGRLKKSRAPMQVVRRPMRLHRAVNDGLRQAGIELLPLGPEVRRTYIERTLREASEEDLPWAADVRVEDWPLNVEGAAFEEDGAAWLGLRFPPTAEGHPLLVRVEGIPAQFGSEDAALRVTEVAWLPVVGHRGRSVGIRALQPVGEELHVLTGPLGSVDKPNAVLLEYPGSRKAPCEHWVLDRPQRGGPLDGGRVRRFELARIEGLAPWEGRGWLYSVDQEKAIALALP